MKKKRKRREIKRKRKLSGKINKQKKQNEIKPI